MSVSRGLDGEGLGTAWGRQLAVLTGHTGLTPTGTATRPPRSLALTSRPD